MTGCGCQCWDGNAKTARALFIRRWVAVFSVADQCALVPLPLSPSEGTGRQIHKLRKHGYGRRAKKAGRDLRFLLMLIRRIWRSKTTALSSASLSVTIGSDSAAL